MLHFAMCSGAPYETDVCGLSLLCGPTSDAKSHKNSFEGIIRATFVRLLVFTSIGLLESLSDSSLLLNRHSGV